MSDAPAPALIADIGGTNARFALARPGAEPAHPLVLPCADFAGPAEAAEAYLRRVTPDSRPKRAAFAIASPVTGDEVEMTNHVWRFSIAAVRRRLGLERLDVINDFAAVALSVPLLDDAHRRAIGGGTAAPGAPVALLGPGTGLGVSALVPAGRGWLPLATEGGHATMPAADEREAAVLAWLRGVYEHVSAERVLSGPGLVNLYGALAAVDGTTAQPATPREVSARALAGACPICAEALAMFFAMLGTVAGNLALSLGARGGVHVAGGIVPQMLEPLRRSRFRERFEGKGRFADYMAAIPTWVVTHPYPAFLGLGGLATRTLSIPESGAEPPGNST